MGSKILGMINLGKVAFAVAVALGLVVAACGGGTSPTPTRAPTAPPTAQPTAVPTPSPTPAPPTPTPIRPRYGGSLRTLAISAPTIFDVQSQRAVPASVVGGAFNWLVQNLQPYYLGGGSAISPDLALQWNISADSKVYTFQLAQNAKWHDGRPVTATDVVASFNRIGFDKNLRTAPSRSTFNSVEKIEAVGDYTVRITLKRVSASFLSLLGSHTNVIYSKAIIDQLPDFKPVGSGPFRFVSYQKDVKVTMDRNPDYFKKDPQGGSLPYLDSMEIFVIPDPAAKLAAFKTGNIDILDTVTRVTESDFKRFKADIPDIVGTPLKNGWLYWTFKNKPPFNDIRVREAFHLAMDRQEWNLITNEGQGDPYILYMNSGGKWTVPAEEVAKWPGFRQPKDGDLAEAKRLLQEAGFDLNTPVVVTMGPTYPDQPIVAADILRRNLGVKTELKKVDRVVYTRDQTSGNFDILYDSISASVDDPVTVFPDFYRSDGCCNWGGWADAELDRIIDGLETTLDTTQRLRAAQEAQKRIALELFWTPTHGGWYRRYMWRGFISGWIPHQGAQDGVPYRHETTWLTK